MFVVSWIAAIVYYALLIFVFAMWGRLIFDFVQALIRSWRPRGVILVIVNIIYTLTDPPLKAVRRFIRPVSFGAISLDFGWTVVMLGAIFAMYIVEMIQFSI
ncbi:MAG: YggT family protein [Actinomycetales bacterium]|nr:YggT family protein [Actinomycetales bacterium]